MLPAARLIRRRWLKVTRVALLRQIAAQERFLDKRNYAYWVGRVQFTGEGERDHQRHVLVECGKRLREISDPRAGYISINGGGTYPITVPSCPSPSQGPSRGSGHHREHCIGANLLLPSQ